MRQEARDEADIVDAEFKANVFANDPRLYYELFERPSGPEIGEIEEVIPQSPEELEHLISSMRREGVID